MDYVEFKELLDLYQSGRYNESDLRELWKTFSDNKNEETIKSFLTKELNELTPYQKEDQNVEFSRIFNTIQSRISEKDNNVKHLSSRKSKIRLINQFIKIAAILLIGLFIGSALTFLFSGNKDEISDTYTTIKAPFGARSLVSLPDGSYVWINAGSSIKYKNSFNKETRTIELEGEAYFKVAKNKSIPFIVNTGGIDIVAVGTEFNVKAYSDEDIIETTLVEGKITIRGDKNHRNNNIKQISLEPQQKAVYRRDQNEFKIGKADNSDQIEMKPAQRLVYVAKKVDPYPIIAWKDNKLVIKGEQLSSLAIKLERKYNVHISFSSKNIKNYKFTGTLEDETLTQVLDVIKLTAPIDYDLDGKEVKILENESMTKKFNDCLKRK